MVWRYRVREGIVQEYHSGGVHICIHIYRDITQIEGFGLKVKDFVLRLYMDYVEILPKQWRITCTRKWKMKWNLLF